MEDLLDRREVGQIESEIHSAGVGNPNTGITLDMGHSLQSQENPAQSLVTIYESGFDAYIHTNDNDTKADWDLVGASRHLLHYVGGTEEGSTLVVDRCAEIGALDVFGDHVLVLDHTSADPLARRALRVAMGTAFALAHARTGRLADVVDAIIDRPVFAPFHSAMQTARKLNEPTAVERTTATAAQ